MENIATDFILIETNMNFNHIILCVSIQAK